jgi:hypothetical protein
MTKQYAKQADKMTRVDRVLIREFLDEYTLGFRFGGISSDDVVAEMSKAFFLLHKEGLPAARTYMRKMLVKRFGMSSPDDFKESEAKRRAAREVTAAVVDQFKASADWQARLREVQSP